MSAHTVVQYTLAYKSPCQLKNWTEWYLHTNTECKLDSQRGSSVMGRTLQDKTAEITSRPEREQMLWVMLCNMCAPPKKPQNCKTLQRESVKFHDVSNSTPQFWMEEQWSKTLSINFPEEISCFKYLLPIINWEWFGFYASSTATALFSLIWGKECSEQLTVSTDILWYRFKFWGKMLLAEHGQGNAIVQTSSCQNPDSLL